MSALIQVARPEMPEVAGYVEAATSDRLLGWAWAPRAPDLRATVELRLGDDVVGRAVADQMRADLASSGIGDGRHAFELAIPDACRSRAAELRVFARAGEGEPISLGAPPAAEALTDQVGRMLRGLDALMGSHRLLHRNLQAVLTKQPGEGGETAAALARLTEVQAAIADQVSAVERFAVRLDERLAGLPQGGAPGRSRAVPGATLWALAASGAALLVSLAGLMRSLGG